MSTQSINPNSNANHCQSMEGYLINENIDSEIISKLDSTGELLKAASVCRSWRRIACMTFATRQMESIRGTIHSIRMLFPGINNFLPRFDALNKNTNSGFVETSKAKKTIYLEITDQLIKDRTFAEIAKPLIKDTSQPQELRTIVANGQILLEKPKGAVSQNELSSWNHAAVIYSLAIGQAAQAEKYAACIQEKYLRDFALQKIVEHYTQTNQIKKAETALNKIESPISKDSSIIKILNAYLKNRDFQKAESCIPKLNNSYDVEQAYVSLADAYASSQQYEKSFQIIEKVKDPDTKHKYFANILTSLKKEDYIKSADSRMDSYSFERFKSLLLEKATKHLRSIKDESERNHETVNFFKSLAKNRLTQQAAFVFDLIPSDHRERSDLMTTLNVICTTEIDFQIERGNFERAQQITWYLRDSDWKDKMLDRITKASLKKQKN